MRNICSSGHGKGSLTAGDLQRININLCPAPPGLAGRTRFRLIQADISRKTLSFHKITGVLISGNESPSYKTLSRKSPDGGAVQRAGMSEYLFNIDFASAA